MKEQGATSYGPNEVPYDDSEEKGRFLYEINPGGALLIWRKQGGQADAVEIAYGPSAWSQVQGNAYR